MKTLSDEEVGVIRAASNEIEDILTDSDIPKRVYDPIFKALDRIDEIVGKG
jgi:hypothetical protein